ncbi:biosynthetic peptidoglycan transglycosylase [Williamsia muralis]|uniref:biosynthetic peptidoglycan transglycosylase n=1 Tax=Williamsia marianensis TaxID=85044 RepID=UPI00381EF22A
MAFALAAAVIAGCLAVTGMTVVPEHFTPDRSAFMKAHKGPYLYQWVDLDHISRYAIAAAIAHEDLAFIDRFAAFDLTDFIDTAKAYLETHDDSAGGSTIPQQLVKNLYLTPEKSITRKGVEALIAYPAAATMTKPRIMELYLNFAQFGPDIFGVCAASWYYFNSAPWDLAPEQAAELAAILPYPDHAVRVHSLRGGIYISDNEYSEKKYLPQLHRIPKDIEFVGGYRVMMDKIGIRDDASAHIASRATTPSCSTMPKMIESTLTEHGY